MIDTYFLRSYVSIFISFPYYLRLDLRFFLRLLVLFPAYKSPTTLVGVGGIGCSPKGLSSTARFPKTLSAAASRGGDSLVGVRIAGGVPTDFQ
jgi:hypothetical protein